MYIYNGDVFRLVVIIFSDRSTRDRLGQPPPNIQVRHVHTALCIIPILYGQPTRLTTKRQQIIEHGRTKRDGRSVCNKSEE